MGADMTGLVLVDRYRLKQRLAQGGMADVYRGIDLRLDRPVAVKIPYPHLVDDPAFVERLRREAQAIAALAHPNVVAVYDQGEADGRPFLVMELVEGESLGSLLSRQCPLPTTLAVGIVLDVLSALEHAHARGIVHRDVKPQNVLLTPEGQAKLADFGIAQAQSSATLSVAGELLGSIHYLAPERLSGQPALPAADLYSVGVLLYQMLVGALPFEGDSTVVIAVQHQQRDPDPPSTRRPELPVWVDEVVICALAKDPSKRYPSASAMRDDLSRRLAAHSTPTEAIRADPLGAVPLRPEFKIPFVAHKRQFRRAAPYAAALGAVVVLSLLALTLGPALSRSISSTTPASGTPTPQTNVATTVAGAPAPAGSVEFSPTPRAATAPPTPTPSVRQRLAALMALVQNRMPRGEAGKQEREILKELEVIEKEIDEGDTKEAADKARELIREVREMASDGEIDRDLSDQLIARLTELAGHIR